MAEAVLIGTRIKAGVWEGILTGQKDAPRLEVLHLEKPLAGVQVTEIVERPGDWAVRVKIPTEALNDGVQTFFIRDVVNGSKLAHFTVIAGMALDDDIRAEVDLLRAELDLLKRAFRRHCVETTG